MNDRVNVGMRAEDLVKGRLVGDVDGVEFRALAGEELEPVDAFFRRIVQVVDDDDLVASFEQLEDGERANVAAATGGERRAVSKDAAEGDFNGGEGPWTLGETVLTGRCDSPGDENASYSHDECGVGMGREAVRGNCCCDSGVGSRNGAGAFPLSPPTREAPPRPPPEAFSR